jgi:hypothetical protein
MNKIYVDALIKARDIFNDHGGARFVLQDAHSRVCAAGALLEAITGSATSAGKYPFVKCTMILSESARELYGEKIIMNVNDIIGFEAVKHCYDHAIKRMTDEKGSA